MSCCYCYYDCCGCHYYPRKASNGSEPFTVAGCLALFAIPFYRWDVLPMFHRSLWHSVAGVAIIAALWGITLCWEDLVRIPYLGRMLKAISTTVTVGSGI